MVADSWLSGRLRYVAPQIRQEIVAAAPPYLQARHAASGNERASGPISVLDWKGEADLRGEDYSTLPYPVALLLVE